MMANILGGRLGRTRRSAELEDWMAGCFFDELLYGVVAGRVEEGSHHSHLADIALKDGTCAVCIDLVGM